MYGKLSYLYLHGEPSPLNGQLHNYNLIKKTTDQIIPQTPFRCQQRESFRQSHQVISNICTSQ